MSGGSQHNPNGRQSQLGSGWSPLQLQMASYLARAPASGRHLNERGHSWHTPTPPPHLYHLPAATSPDPLQVMKVGAGSSNPMFRHSTTPPDIFRHTPTPPDKHLLRHTPSPGDPKAGVSISPVDLFPHMGPTRDKLVHPDELLYPRAGVDLSLSRSSSNGAPLSLSVRDAPTINSLIARAPALPLPLPHPGNPTAPASRRVDSLLERLAPSVIVHARPTEEDDEPPKRKRKPEKTLRLTSLPNGKEHVESRRKTQSESSETIDEIAAMIAADDLHEGKLRAQEEALCLEAPVSVDKLKSVLASPDPKRDDVETNTNQGINNCVKSDNASDANDACKDLTSNKMNAKNNQDVHKHGNENQESNLNENVNESNKPTSTPPTTVNPATEPKNVTPTKSEVNKSPQKVDDSPEVAISAAAPKRRSARLSDSANVPVESPSEGRPAETLDNKNPEPTTAFVEVETELEKMFAGIEEPANENNPQKLTETKNKIETKTAKKRRKSVATKGERKARRPSRTSIEESVKKKPGRKKQVAVKQKKERPVKDTCDSGSNASSSKSRGPYIQIRGPRETPASVCVMNAGTGEEEGEARRAGEFRAGTRARGLHASTLGLRYDAATRDLSWLCAFCGRPPHADRLGDLFGPYSLASGEAWLHEDCAVWAPGLVAAGARLWGLQDALDATRAVTCCVCGSTGAGLACGARSCPRRAHLPCARGAAWTLDTDSFRASCPDHRPPPPVL